MAKSVTPRAPAVWWLHPGLLLLCYVVPLYLFLVYVVPRVWPDVIVLKSLNYMNGFYASLGLLLLTLFGAFAMLGARIAIDRPSHTGYQIAPAYLGSVGALTIAAYAIWFFPILIHGQLLMERDELNQMPGITSFTQMGSPFVLCYLQCSLTSGQRFPRFVRWELWAILFLTVARVFIWSERLAMIEVFVPALVLLLTHTMPRGRALRGLRSVIALAGPYIAIPLLLVGFTLTEYFRSWKTYQHTQQLSLAEFMSSRVVTYYFTALNNGAGMLATGIGKWPTYKFVYTAGPLYCLPGGVGEAFRVAFTGQAGWPHSEFLEHYADVEFNNISGVFPFVYDAGIIGACVYFSVLGLLIGMLYRSLISRGKLGAILFPPAFVGCIEVLRITYLNGPRMALMFVGAVFLLSRMRPAGISVSWAQRDGQSPALLGGAMRNGIEPASSSRA